MEFTLSPQTQAMLSWKTSTRSGAAGHCVETAQVPNGMLVRDSKDRSGPVLSFTAGTWMALIEGIQNGTFDR